MKGQELKFWALLSRPTFLESVPNTDQGRYSVAAPDIIGSCPLRGNVDYLDIT